jgi:hypothetical protein
MFADASGEKKMKIGKGASATEKPADAVSDKPAGTTKPAAGTTTKPAAGTTTKPADAATKTRLLQDANATKAANTTAATPAKTTAAAPANTDWKKLKGEDEYMRVIVNEKMFLAGGPLAGTKRPIIMFNKHGSDYVKDFPRAKKGTYDAATGKKVNKTAAVAPLAAAAGVNVTGATVEEGDDELEDTVAQQVMELEFIDGDTMEDIKISGLKKGMLKICMMMKNANQKLSYMNEENDQLQDDGVSEASKTQISTRDDTNQ